MGRLELPPKERTIFIPEGGWKEQTYYVVDVSWRTGNPLHRRILYIGFIPDFTKPFSGGYTCMLAREGDEAEFCHPKFAHYLKVISEIPDMSEEN